MKEKFITRGALIFGRNRCLEFQSDSVRHVILLFIGALFTLASCSHTRHKQEIESADTPVTNTTQFSVSNLTPMAMIEDAELAKEEDELTLRMLKIVPCGAQMDAVLISIGKPQVVRKHLLNSPGLKVYFVEYNFGRYSLVAYFSGELGWRNATEVELHKFLKAVLVEDTYDDIVVKGLCEVEGGAFGRKFKRDLRKVISH